MCLGLGPKNIMKFRKSTVRRAVGLSGEPAFGSDVAAACRKSPRSMVCKFQPGAWLIDTGSGHDLVDFALVLGGAQLIEPAHSNILPHTAKCVDPMIP